MAIQVDLNYGYLIMALHMDLNYGCSNEYELWILNQGYWKNLLKKFIAIYIYIYVVICNQQLKVNIDVNCFWQNFII
jgi:hypothetical protein